MKIAEAKRQAIADPNYTANQLVASVEEVKDSIRRQEEHMKKYDISAPISGVILEIYVKEGELAVSGQSIMKIASDTRKFVVVAIDEQYLPNIRIDQEAILVSNQLSVRGRIEEIAPTINRETGTVDIRVEILEKLEAFLQNMTIRVDIKTVKTENALVIPGNYLVEKDGLKVYIQNNDNKVEAVEVEVYNKNLPMVNVTTGLKKGMILLDPEGLEEGMSVELKTEGVDGP